MRIEEILQQSTDSWIYPRWQEMDSRSATGLNYRNRASNCTTAINQQTKQKSLNKINW